VPATPTDIPQYLHDQPQLMVCIGLPASGKTWWATQLLYQAFVEGLRGKYWRTNRDDYRRMMLDPGYPSSMVSEIEDVIITLQYQQIHLLLSGGCHVICDDTNLNPSYLENLLALATTTGAIVLAQDFTHVPVEVCINRDLLRAGSAAYVGERVIRSMHERYIAPHADQPVHPCLKMIRATGGVLVGEHQ
jgi:predicted kinase